MSVELQLCGLRCFLRFLILQDVPAQSLLDAVPTVKARKQNRIPSVWTKEHVEKLIQAIDRGNPAGKRDCAIILLAARLGIRTIEIKRLKLTDLNWAERARGFTSLGAFKDLIFLAAVILISLCKSRPNTEPYKSVNATINIDRMRLFPVANSVHSTFFVCCSQLLSH